MFLLDQKLEGSGLKTWAQDFDRIFCTPIPRLHLLRVPEPRGSPQVHQGYPRVNCYLRRQTQVLLLVKYFF